MRREILTIFEKGKKMKKNKLTVWMFIVVAMLSGLVDTADAQVSPWPMEGGNRFHTRRTSIVGPTVPVLKWSVCVSGWHPGEPSIGLDGNIYVPSSGGYLTAVSPLGSVVWQRPDHPYSSPPTPAVAENGNLYTYCNPGGTQGFSCLTPGGEIVWSKTYDSGFKQSPTIAADGYIYFHNGKYTVSGDLVGAPTATYNASTPISEGRGVNPDIYFTDAHYWGDAHLQSCYLGSNDQNEPVWLTRWSYHFVSNPVSAATVSSEGNVIVMGGGTRLGSSMGL